MQIGYARVSTADQDAGLEAQIRDLEAAGCSRIFQERVSSIQARAQLDAALDYVRDGDVLYVCKPDRLARSVQQLLDIVERLERKQVGLVILSMGGQRVETGQPTGRLMLTMLGAVAEFERALMLERQREGIRRAHAQGKFKGRVPTARRRTAEILALAAEGLKAPEIARRLGLGRSSVYEILAENRPEEPLAEEMPRAIASSDAA